MVRAILLGWPGLVSDRSIWHNGKYLRFQSDLQQYYCQLALIRQK